MSSFSTLRRYYLLSFEKNGADICEFASLAQSSDLDSKYDEHILILKKTYGVDGLIFMTYSNRILYLFTTDFDIDESDFLKTFFPSTHPDLGANEIESLLGNTLLFRGEEALTYLFNFSLNPSHLDFIPLALSEALKKSDELGISNSCLTLLVDQLIFAKDQIKKTPRSSEDYRSFHQRLIIDNLILLSERHVESMLSKRFKEVPIEITKIKKRAIDEVFAKEIENVDDETVDLIRRMMKFMEDECKEITLKKEEEK